MALSVNIIYFPFNDNFYWDFWNTYDLLDLPIVLIHSISSATIADNSVFLTFCMLVGLTIKTVNKKYTLSQGLLKRMFSKYSRMKFDALLLFTCKEVESVILEDYR